MVTEMAAVTSERVLAKVLEDEPEADLRLTLEVCVQKCNTYYTRTDSGIKVFNCSVSFHSLNPYLLCRPHALTCTFR